MARFAFSHTPLDPAVTRAALLDPTCGGYASFEGWVRNHNEGLEVRRLEYEAFEPLAIKEGERIVAEAIARFQVERAACVHRIGDLGLGELAVWVGVSARHRDEAFRACRYIIDEVKHRVPIWKKEHYVNGDSGWVNCERCATVADATHLHSHSHPGGADPHAHANPTPDYSRQLALKEVGAAGQARLAAARVAVVGCGGLGVPVISYLAGAGVGHLSLIDSDRLEASNLHRQTLYALADVGVPKAELAAARVRALNPDVGLAVHVVRLTPMNAESLVADHDVVVDCSDNFATKFLLNDTCVRLRKPAVFASVYQYEGQLQIVRPERGGACLRCVWPEATRDGVIGNCAEAGVLGPVPGVFGSLQAFEVLKLLLELPGRGDDEIVTLDLLTLTVARIRLRRASDCPDHALRAARPADALPAEALELSFESLAAAAVAGFHILDIREADELLARPTHGAAVQHLPMAELLYGSGLAFTGRRLLLCCASGKRSLAAARELRARGIDSVFSLRGGLAALAPVTA